MTRFIAPSPNCFFPRKKTLALLCKVLGDPVSLCHRMNSCMSTKIKHQTDQSGSESSVLLIKQARVNHGAGPYFQIKCIRLAVNIHLGVYLDLYAPAF